MAFYIKGKKYDEINGEYEEEYVKYGPFDTISQAEEEARRLEVEKYRDGEFVFFTLYVEEEKEVK